MTLILSGTDGLSDIDGSAATPAIRGTDANTGIFFGTDIIGFSEGGVEAMRIDSSGNVGIGTSSPVGGYRLNVVVDSGNAQQLIRAGTNFNSTIAFGDQNSSTSGELIYAHNGDFMAFNTNAAERMRIDSSGKLLVNTTSATGSSQFVVAADTTSTNVMSVVNTRTTAATDYSILFYRAGNIVGSVQTTLSATSFVTSSDYRLKENIAPMMGALSAVAQLKPCTYNWKLDGTSGQGFIAHELAEVVPDCVTGEKDAVNEDGSVKPQGIDTSFLVATLTAAIQEQQALITALTARITALETQSADNSPQGETP